MTFMNIVKDASKFEIGDITIRQPTTTMNYGKMYQWPMRDTCITKYPIMYYVLELL